MDNQELSVTPLANTNQNLEPCSQSTAPHLHHQQQQINQEKEQKYSDHYGTEGTICYGEDIRKRTIIMERKNSSFGFTLQTYGIHHLKQGEIELLTYVDCVDDNGPASRAGMRPGDVILSINGKDMEDADHRTIVQYIQSCQKTMRIVVLFEDCVRKVELHIKYLKMKRLLNQKIAEYEILCERENHLLKSLKKDESAADTGKDKLSQTRYSLTQEDRKSLEDILRSISSLYQAESSKEIVINCRLNQGPLSLKFLAKYPELSSSSSYNANMADNITSSSNLNNSKLTKSCTLGRLPSSNENDFITHL